MKIFISKINSDKIEKILLNCDAKEVSTIVIENYIEDVTILGYGNIKTSENSTVLGQLYSIQEAKLWDLYQSINPLLMYSEEIGDDIAGMFVEHNAVSKFSQYDVEIKKQKTIQADILLMIPGYIKNTEKLNFENIDHKVGNTINQLIKSSADYEFNNELVKNNFRMTIDIGMFAFGIVENTLSFSCLQEEVKRGNVFLQPGAINLLVNKKTNLCVVEIYMPNISVNVEETLSYHISGCLKFVSGTEVLSINEFLLKKNIDACGDKRSIVFSNEKIANEKLLNVLVNEKEPMGKIVGSHFTSIINNNLAQYDTAEVYVSETTMIELVKTPCYNIFERQRYQAIEVFFVEMLLLQDAVVNKMNIAAKRHIDKERANPFSVKTNDVVSDLLNDMSYYMDFSNYSNFYYPTVRVSAEAVANSFGVCKIRAKFQENKELLQQMSDNHNFRLKERDNKIKSILLFCFTFFSGIGVLYDIVVYLFAGVSVMLGGFIAFCIMIAGIGLYFVLSRVNRSLLRKRMRHHINDKK